MAAIKYDGPIEPGMIFTAPDNDGVLGLRRLRVLARHPDNGDLIYDEQPSRMRRVEVGRIGRCPELNLRIVFEREAGQEGSRS